MGQSFRSRAPLRLGLAGGGTDVSPYCDQYGGSILNATIDRFVIAQLTTLDEPKVEFEIQGRDINFAGAATYPLKASPQFVLFEGVYNRIVRDYLGGKAPGLRLTAQSDAPPGSGLGASSTMVVAILSVFQEAFNLPLGEYDIAHLAYEIERVDLGLAGGKQDQYAAAFGGFNFMEFYDNDKVIVNPLRIKRETILELELSTILYFTGVSRESATIIEDQKKTSQVDDARLKAMHQMKADSVQMKEFLLRGQIKELGYHLRGAWEAKRKTSSKVSNTKIDEIVESTLEKGAYGGKVSGAGGGGFLYFIADPSRAVAILNHLRTFGGSAETVRYTDTGVESWTVGH